jgi:hypothetical protein
MLKHGFRTAILDFEGTDESILKTLGSVYLYVIKRYYSLSSKYIFYNIFHLINTVGS